MKNNTSNGKLMSIILISMMCLVAYFSIALSEIAHERVTSEPEQECETTSELLYSSSFDQTKREIPAGLSAGDWDNIQIKLQKARYYPTWNQAVEGYIASNLENQWSLTFDDGAALVNPISGEDWLWLLTPFGYGYESYIQSLCNDPKIIIHENRIEFVYNEDLTGWYINDEFGLEHGFTLASPPQPRTSENLLFEMSLQTSLTPIQINDGENIVFLDGSEKEILNYGKLMVKDAEGHIIPSELYMLSDTITISVDDTNAEYPLTIDPLLISNITKIWASDGAVNERFGSPVSISGDAVVVGVEREDIGGNNNQGSAYIFERNQSGLDNWGEVVKLTASDGEADDRFGVSVSIFGDTVAVGALLEDSGITTNQGAVYVFDRNQGGPNNWGEVVKVLASDGLNGDQFGVAVSIDGDTMVVGASYDDVGGMDNRGSAYVFYRNQGGTNNWGEVRKLIALDGLADDYFGDPVFITDDTVAVGVMYDDIGINLYQGSVYIFERDEGGSDNWGEVTKITASNGSGGDCFGNSVSVSKDTLVVGASGDDGGSAYIFERDEGGEDNWGEVAWLPTPESEFIYMFGYSVSISGDTVVIGAPWDDIDENEGQGSAYVYHRNQGGENNWGMVDKITASDGEANDTFGHSVSISGDTFIIGAPNDNVSGNDNQGSAYIFYLSSSNNIPIITTSDITTTYEDSQYYVDYEANDLDGDTLTWSLWTDADEWLSIDSVTGILSGTPHNSHVGFWTVNVSVSDGHGGIDFSNFSLEVINTNDAPVIITGNINSANADELYSVDYEATDDDLDTLSWDLDTNATWLDMDSSTGILSGTPDESDVGSYHVNVSVYDGNGGGDFTVFTLNVYIHNNAPVIVTDDVESAFENVLYSVDYEATDEDLDPLTWALDTNASFLTIDSSSGILSGTPSESDVGIYWVKVSVSDGNLGIDVSEFTLTVFFDNDGDGIADSDDTDDDNDGYPDSSDDFPEDPSESKDTDSDGTGNNADDDDDDDGYPDDEDDFPLDIAASKDTDNDGKPDNWNVGYDENDTTTGLVLDEDDDDDGVPDVDDKYPLDPSKSGDEEDEAMAFLPYLVLIIIILLIIVILAATRSKGKTKSEGELAPFVLPSTASFETQWLTCPSCQNSFEVSKSATTITCPHCGFSEGMR